jgi:hypothetical protein
MHIVQKANRAVEMLELKGLEVFAFHGLQPLAALKVSAGLTQPLQRQRKAGALRIELKPALGAELMNQIRQSLFVPESVKDQSRPPAAGFKAINLRLPRGRKRLHRPGEARQILDQGIDLTGFLQPVQPAQGADDALADGFAVSKRFYNLKVVPRAIFGAAFLGTYKHGHFINCLLQRAFYIFRPEEKGERDITLQVIAEKPKKRAGPSIQDLFRSPRQQTEF